MSIIDDIRKRHHAQLSPGSATPDHKPEMLYIGCIDARLDPIDDIGIPMGKALIFRNVGAIVAGLNEQEKPRYLSEAASVEFAVNVMKVKHIVVAGHTFCGGLNACLHGCDTPETKHVHEYLQVLADVRAEVLAHQHDTHAHAQAMEEGAVRKSINNLLTYPFVREAVKRGELQLHGWVMDTASKQISEMNSRTLEFEPMAT